MYWIIFEPAFATLGSNTPPIVSVIPTPKKSPPAGVPLSITGGLERQNGPAPSKITEGIAPTVISVVAVSLQF